MPLTIETPIQGKVMLWQKPTFPIGLYCISSDIYNHTLLYNLKTSETFVTARCLTNIRSILQGFIPSSPINTSL